jgi:hypothetical protein
VKPRSGQFFISALRDGKTYAALDFATAEAKPDDVIAALSDHRLLWLFGEDSIELFYNSGNADFPFERVASGVIEVGLAAAETPATGDNSVFWLGVEESGGFVVYRNQGFSPIRISTHAIESAIEGYSRVDNAVGFFYRQEGHGFYVLTFPGNGTWVYDTTTQLWHERDSRNAFNASIGEWRARRHAFVFNKHIVSDLESGQLYELDLETFTDGQTVQRVMTTSTLHNNRDRATMRRFELDVQRGVGLSSGQGSDPQALFQFSDDGGHTFSNEQSRSIGKIGEYKVRAIVDNWGEFYERIIKVTLSDPVPFNALTGWMEVEPGSG